MFSLTMNKNFANAINPDSVSEFDFRRDFPLFKHERWLIFPTEKEICSVLAVSFPTF